MYNRRSQVHDLVAMDPLRRWFSSPSRTGGRGVRLHRLIPTSCRVTGFLTTSSLFLPCHVTKSILPSPSGESLLQCVPEPELSTFTQYIILDSSGPFVRFLSSPDPTSPYFSPVAPTWSYLCPSFVSVGGDLVRFGSVPFLDLS